MAAVITALTVNPDGYSGKLRITGCSVGATYNQGTTFGTFKGVITVVSKGFDTAGLATTTTRTVYIIAIGYKEAPPANSYAYAETTVGADIDVTVIFSDPIYVKDNTGAGNSGTAPVLNVSSGFATNTAGDSSVTAAAGPITVTNNSTLAYPKALARMLTLPYQKLTGSFEAGVIAFAKFGIATVKHVLADGTVTRNSFTSLMTQSSDPDGIPGYWVVDNATNFTQSANVTYRPIVYPIVGDTTEIQDGNDNAFAGSIKFATLPLGVCDKNGTYGTTYCILDPVNGVDSSATAYSSESAAETAWSGNNATAAKTMGKAMSVIQAYNNTNYSRNTVDAGVIVLKSGGVKYGVGLFTIAAHSACALTVKRSSTTTRANAQITGFDTDSRYGCKLIRLNDLSIVSSSAANQLIGFLSTGFVAILEDVDCTGSGSTNPLFSGNNGEGHLWYKNVTLTAFLNGLAVGNDNMALLARNCSMSDAASSSAFTKIRCVIKCFTHDGLSQAFWGDNGLDSSVWQDTANCIVAWNMALKMNGYFANGVLGEIAVVGNVVESINNTAQPIMEYSLTGTGSGINNLMIMQNTFAGERNNIENDITAPLVDGLSTNNTIKNNSFSRFATLSHSADSAMSLTGHRSVDYGVSVFNNHERNNALGLIPWTTGLWTIGSGSLYTNDKSFDTSAVGSGDYTPAAGSQLLNRISSVGDIVTPYSLLADRTFQSIGIGDAIGGLQIRRSAGNFSRALAYMKHKQALHELSR